MSRTKRKHHYVSGDSEVAYINRQRSHGNVLVSMERDGPYYYCNWRDRTAEDHDIEDAESAKEYHTFGRDGTWNETGRNQGFKHEAKKYVRNANKKFCRKVIDGVDYDDDAMPIRKEGKQFSWNWF
jgi:hypothetical protein